jgi:hypothetical protein
MYAMLSTMLYDHINAYKLCSCNNVYQCPYKSSTLKQNNPMRLGGGDITVSHVNIWHVNVNYMFVVRYITTDE